MQAVFPHEPTPGDGTVDPMQTYPRSFVERRGPTALDTQRMGADLDWKSIRPRVCVEEPK